MISATPARHKTAIRKSWLNLAASSFFLSRAQYALTVFKEIFSFAAISKVALPSPSKPKNLGLAFAQPRVGVNLVHNNNVATLGVSLSPIMFGQQKTAWLAWVSLELKSA
jgi:hypothetical protein